MTKPQSEGEDWRSLYKIGAWSSLIIVGLMPIQIVIFIIWPPPNTVQDWFNLLQNNWLLGLLNLDLLYLLTNLLLVPMYLALYAALKRANESWMLLALALGLIGITAYCASNPVFEMLDLSKQHAAAVTDAKKMLPLAAGTALLATSKGTAFNVYYLLDAVFLLIVSVVMLRSSIFSRATAFWGAAAGLLMAVPSSVENIGPIFALASLIPWAVFSVLVAHRLFRLSRSASGRSLIA